MTINERFLEYVREAFRAYLQSGTSRSPKKLTPLHSAIAADLEALYGPDFTVKSIGHGDGKEAKICGRYHQKAVDITILKGEKPVAGYAVKFVVRNYKQNSVNYFENMLGETANIRSTAVPYFQLFIIFDQIPHYDNHGFLQKYEKISPHNLEKYLALSKDDPSIYYHTPDKTLVAILHLNEPETGYFATNGKEYSQNYLSVIDDRGLLGYTQRTGDPFDESVIYNDYEDFIQRTYYIAMGKLKK